MVRKSYNLRYVNIDEFLQRPGIDPSRVLMRGTPYDLVYLEVSVRSKNAEVFRGGENRDPARLFDYFVFAAKNYGWHSDWVVCKLDETFQVENFGNFLS